MKTKTKFAVAAVCAALVLLLAVLVLKVDVAPTGPEGTVIGLSRLNGAVFAFTGVHTDLYELTQMLGYFALLCGFFFALLGLIQLIKRKNLFKVDVEILALGVLFIVTIVLYALFNKVTVNCRPVMLPDETEPEASFPSSHTMLACVMFGGIMTIMRKYVKRDALRTALKAVCAVLIVVTVCCRLASGAHWYTDIIAGLLISAALLAVFSGVLDILRKKRRAARKAARAAREAEAE